MEMQHGEEWNHEMIKLTDAQLSKQSDGTSMCMQLDYTLSNALYMFLHIYLIFLRNIEKNININNQNSLNKLE